MLGVPAFGVSVALSGDGDTALVGGPGDNGRVGAAWVFTRSGSSWTQQGPKLLASDEVGEGHFGGKVALSADGTTALIGGRGDGGLSGAAWVFTRSGSTLEPAGPQAPGPEANGAADFGGERRAVRRRQHGADRRLERRHRIRRRVGVHALGIDVDAAGTEDHSSRSDGPPSSAKASRCPPTATRR